MPLYEFPNKAFPADIFDLGGDAQGNPGGTAWDAKEQVMRTIADTMGFKYVISSAITDADVAAADFPCLIMDRRSDENDPPKYGLKDSSNIKTIAACKNPFTETNMQMLKMFFGADHELIKRKHRDNVGLLIADGTVSDDFGGGPYPDNTNASTGWVAKGNIAGQPRMWRDLRDIAKPGDKVWDASKSEYTLFKSAGGGAAVFAGGSTFAISVNKKQTLTGYIPRGLDANGNPLTGFTLSGVDATRFKIGATGEIEFVIAPNFNTPFDADANNTYEISVVASDGSEQAVTINVLDINSNDCISAGGAHSLILLFDRTVKSFGYNGTGQLGVGSTVNQTTPVSVIGITNAIAVSAGYGHSLVVLDDGKVKSFGSNNIGQLGNGNQTVQLTPVSVTGITNAIAASAGNEHSLVVLDDGKVKSFGRNSYGQLGNGNNVNQFTPVSVIGITNAIAASAGGEHSLILLDGGKVKSFGRGSSGLLGSGTSNNQNSPVDFVGVTNAIAVSASYRDSLVLLDGGIVKKNNPNLNYIAKDVAGIGNAVAISTGTHFSLVVLDDGKVKSFGRNSSGQLGNGNTVNQSTPVSVIGISKVAA